MVIRRLAQLSLVCLATCLHLSAQANQGTGFLFQAPGANGSGTRLLGYQANVSDLNPDVDTTGPAHANKFLATPNGERFYIVGDGPLQSMDASLTNFQTLNGVAGPIRAAKLTPDGKYLLVAGADFYVVNTATNAVVATNLGVSGTLLDFTISRDSKKAFLLQSFTFVSAITPVNLDTLTGGTRKDITRNGTNIEMSPLGRLYVSSGNVVAEYDPADLSLAAEMILSATPGPMHFNSDGSRLYFINKTPQIGFQPIFSIKLSNREVSSWNLAGTLAGVVPVFDDILVAGNDRLFAYEPASTTLWDINPITLGGSPTALSTIFPANKVFAVAVSDEVPSSRFLYVLSENGNQASLMRISLANNTVSAVANSQLTTGVLRYVSVPPQTGAANFIKTNDGQVLPTGGAAKELITRVTDNLGRPVFKQPVSFTPEANKGVTISNPDTITNADGYVSTTVTVPNEPGIYTITVLAGAASTSYTVTVPERGGGTPGGPQLISIYGGDGQLVQEFNSTPYWAPLTAQVVDSTGKPRINAAVAFSIVDGIGVLAAPEDHTDIDGLVRTGFFAINIPFGLAFQTLTVRATSDFGSVDFHVTVFHTNNDGSGQPQILLTAPNASEITVTQGDIIPGLFQATVFSTNFPQIGVPIPGVGMRIADGFDYTMPGPGRCANNPSSDNLGLTRCDFQASCNLVTNTPLQVVVGEYRIFTLFMIVKPGTANKITYVSGNNQSGTAGQQLSQLLTAKVSDNCGSPVGNATVTWTVLTGSATLTQVTGTSNSAGVVSARVNLGQSPGPVQIRVSLANAVPVVFTATNSIVVSSVSLLSGGGQTAFVNQQFANPVVFQVRDNNQNPVGAGLIINFSITGVGSINPTSASTNAQGQVQTTATAGNAAGTVTVTASYLALTASATLTANVQGPPLTSASFTNNASGANGLVACGLATGTGTGLASSLNSLLSGISQFGPLPYSLGDIDSVKVNQVSAPIRAVANINGKQTVDFQVPCETQTGNATVSITVKTGATTATTTVTGVPVLAGQPGIYTYGLNNKIYGAVQRAKDGSYISPTNLAPTGETFYLYLTGMGQVTPPTVTNAAGIPNQNISQQTVVGVNNKGVPVTTARYLPGSIGVYYIEFTIPKETSVAPGTVLAVDVPLAAAMIINGQTVFGVSVLLPGIVQGQ
ncbi:MAG: hypothetical protein ABI811_10530 [Acidobacteriota bacterium]